MPVASPPSRSTLRLSEAARHVIYPSGIVQTLWPLVEAQLALMGVKFDEWQVGFSRITLGLRADDKFAATVGGVTATIPRQVGKTFTIGSLVFALCILFPRFRVIWTAHRTRTTTNTFKSMQAMAKRKRIAPHIAYIRTANGEQEIGFVNGSVILFGAREQGFGRGFDEIDVEVFDEAQILTEKALEDMIAATNQARNPHGALLFFIGTPPRPVDPGEAFTLRREKALSGKSRDAVYVEFSADPDADPDDHEQWAKANISYPHRTPHESMLRMRENLPSDEAWLREALGIWDAKGSDAVISATDWMRVADPASMPVDRLSLAVDINPARTVGTVALAGQRADGQWHIEVDEHRNGVDWIAPWLIKRCERNEIRAVVIDGMSPAATLEPELKKAGIRVMLTTARDMATACGALYDGVMAETLRHTDQPQLNVALSVARKRPLLVDAWGWSRKTTDSDITPVVASTLALWGAQTNAPVKRPTRSKTGGRRVVTF